MHFRIVIASLFLCRWFDSCKGEMYYVPKLTGRLPALPSRMTSNQPGTWAYDTMSRRVVEDILTRIIDDNADELTRPTSPLRSECLLQLNDLKSSLLAGHSGFLRGLCDGGGDLEVWDQILTSVPDEQRNWLDAPWIISEFYLYRRVAEAFKYFETGYDCFAKQKVQGLIEALKPIEDVASRLDVLIANGRSGQTDVSLEIAIQTSLWGNKMDLSLWPAAATKSSSQQTEEKASFRAALEVGRSYILDDHTSAVVSNLINSPKSGGKVISIIVDNAGYELVSDMMLGHTLLELGVASKVVFHTKAHPTFVSDATNEDCEGTIDFLSGAPSEHTAALATAWRTHVVSGKFEFSDDLFWCQPTAFWDMPDHIQAKLADSAMVFVKGDANYRRLLGERDWPLDTEAATVLSYWPVPVCALRTFKAEIGCGISAEAQRRASEADPKWMVSGRWGVVQVGGPSF